MDKSQIILSDITVYMKYAKFLDHENRRETWDELVTRNKNMHIKSYPQIKDEIEEAYKLVYTKKVLPSMRSMQFAGKPIEISPNRIYNCAYMPIDHLDAFSETMFLLLNGSGVGYSVQKHHIEALPEIRKPNQNRKRRFLIGDSIEGWADTIKVLLKSYFGEASSTPVFDYSDVRPKGARLVTSGGKAPGPQPLKDCVHQLQSLLDSKKNGDMLTPLEVHDMICYIADAVLAGGIRRAALISLFSADDQEMLSAKTGNWWEKNPQRGRSNNSAVLLRHRITEDFFKDIWKRVELSGSGEPGIYLTNDKDWGTNPCCLTGDTPIYTDNGEIRLDDIIKKYKEGEALPLLWTYNEKTKEKELDYIEAAAMTRKDAEIIKIELDNGTNIRLTPDHKVFTKNRGWIESAKLTESDELLLYGKITAKIKKITIEKNEDVYDIQMAKNHNFFANKILVHNCEIALKSNSFCNLCEINVSDVGSQEDYNERCKIAAFIGTLQAGYTNFHYLRDVWKKNTERDSLIGISMTGIGSGTILGYDMKEGAKIVKKENARVANLIGINKAARTTAVKPSGTASLVLGTSSGIHAWHSEYYIRRIRVTKNEAIYKHLITYHPELIEDDYFRPHDTAIIKVPQKAPEGAILRTESPFQLLERIKKVTKEWVKPGHIKGSNSHNISATISLKPEDWDLAGDWMWKNRNFYNGLSVLPYDGGSYTQAPFEECTKEVYDTMMLTLTKLNLKDIKELTDETDLSGELACAGGNCTIV